MQANARPISPNNLILSPYDSVIQRLPGKETISAIRPATRDEADRDRDRSPA